MTAGLPGTRSVGSTFHRRILAAILVMTIAIAPARAYEAVALTLDSTPVSREFEIESDAAQVVTDTPDEPAPDALTETPASESDAQSTADPAAAEPATPPIDQVLYKGVVGNLLEAMPLDPEQRVQLQRGNAVINNAFAGRSLALLLGIASPPLMVVGLIWGIWSAVNIKPSQADIRTAIAPLPQPGIQTEQSVSAGEPAAAASSGNEPADPAEVAAQAGE
jgi:hypothetical protein